MTINIRLILVVLAVLAGYALAAEAKEYGLK